MKPTSIECSGTEVGPVSEHFEKRVRERCGEEQATTSILVEQEVCLLVIT